MTQPTMVQARAVLKAEARHACHKGGMLKLKQISFSGSVNLSIWFCLCLPYRGEC